MSDETDLATYAEALATAAEEALPGWVETCIRRVAIAAGATVADLEEAAAEAGRQAAADVGPRLRTLLGQDVDEQRSNPLAVLRTAVAYPTAILRDARVPPVVRTDFDKRAFPDDAYGLTPATWSDLDPSVQEPGLVWGAAKAHVVLTRRRAEGVR